MESVIHGLYAMFGVFLLCTGFSTLFLEENAVDVRLKQQETSIIKEDVMYEDFEEIKQYISYEEIVASLLKDIEYPIKIETIEISPEEFDPELFDFSLIPQGDYRKIYFYNQDKGIEYIQYQKAGDENNG